MSDTSDNIIVDTATRIFQDLCEPATINDAEKGAWPKALWDALVESGLPLTWVPDELGGAGATLAGEVAAASAAADGAAEACSGPEIGLAEVAIAKVRGGEAAGTGAAIAHQVHGAMGFTYEHSLHHATRRLWAWREEFGNEAVWAQRLGRMVARHGADQLWSFITQGS